MTGDDITIFICGRRDDECTCSVPGCSSPAPHRCSFPLGGSKAGTTCDRPLCPGHTPVVALCPPHRRLVEAQEEAARR
jgi:hypothetical protein